MNRDDFRRMMSDADNAYGEKAHEREVEKHLGEIKSHATGINNRLEETLRRVAALNAQMDRLSDQLLRITIIGVLVLLVLIVSIIHHW